MSVGDARCKDLCPGQRVSLTGRIASGGSQSFQALWHDEVFHLDALVLGAGVWTLYDFQYMGIRDGYPVLAKCEGSQHYACGSILLDSYRKIVELCSGMGGLATGITRLGGLPVLQVDKTALACEVVALNGGNALQGDVCRPEVQMQIHAQVEGQACLFAAGFPCQPFSCQGSRLGFADARGVVLHSILTTVWRTQSAGLILECVADVMDFPEVSQLLHAFADHANFQYSEVCLELADQWVSRRRRWWATLLPKSSHLFYLVEWPRLNPRPVISNVMPELPLWAEHEERQLAWTDEETAKMLNPAYGTDARFLSMHDTAPTALHSWGNALGPCPCGCRSQGFSEARLQSGGLRGVGVQSAALQRPRFLHPAEAGLLNSLPLTFKLPADMRAGLCLVGLLSAPLQSMWIYSQVLHWAETGLSGSSCILPRDELERFQRELVAQAREVFVVPSMFLPRDLHFTGALGDFCVAANQPVSVGQLLAAERHLAGPGYVYQVWDRERSLEDAVLLHSKCGPYELKVRPKSLDGAGPSQPSPFKVICLVPQEIRFFDLTGPTVVSKLAESGLAEQVLAAARRRSVGC